MPKESTNQSEVIDFRKKYLSMATKEFNNSFVSLLRTRTQVIYISSNEEKRLLEYIHSVATDRGYEPFEWDCFSLMRKIGTKEKINVTSGLDLRYPEQVLSFVIEELEKREKKKEEGNGAVYVLCDFYRYLSPERCNPQIERQIKHINKLTTNCHVIFTGPTYISNHALEKEISVLDFPFPNEKEIKQVLTELTSAEKVKTGVPGISKILENNEEELINSVKGLTTNEARHAYSKSIVMANHLGIKPLDINLILQEKKEIIKKTDILEYVDSNVTIDNIGGLDDLVRWLNIRKVSFSKDAIDYGLKPPKGVLLLGLPGTGKSLTAKATASAYNMPLLRLDFGKMFNSLVGESEKIARHAIKLAETVAPCVSGESVVYDENGKSYKIKNLLDMGNGDNPMYTYSLNEKTWKLEKTRVKAVIKHAEKKKMLKINAPTGSIEVTEDHKMMINRDGDLLWVEAKDITNKDALVVSKNLIRNIKDLNVRDLFSNKKKSDITIRSGGKLHSANISTSTISLMHLAIISGMIDSNGCCDEQTGDIMLSSPDKSILHFFSSALSEAFLTEPEINSTIVKLNNKVVSKMICSFLDNLGSQSEEIVSFYLAGYFHASGVFGFVDKTEDPKRKPYIQFSNATENVFDRLRKSLLVHGIIAFKSKLTSMILDFSNIKTFFEKVPVLTKKKAHNVNDFLNYIESNPPARISVFGYKLGKSLSSLKSVNGMTKERYDSISIFEDNSIMMQYNLAHGLSDVIKKDNPGNNPLPITKLVESDIVCVSVYSVETAGEQWAYDLSCEKNHNFFANGFLCHNCILWADEIEKGLAGGVGSGSGDSGTTKRVIGTFLTWLQEKTAPVFVICTANNVQDIPPEFMRAGRFDEVFFVDLPTTKGREQIFSVLLKKFKYNPGDFHLDELAFYTKDFSGAEIEKCIENAMFECFCDGKRRIQTSDLILSCRSISPLSKTRDKEFEEMRNWAKTRCKFANTLDENNKNSSKNNGSINLDLDS